MPVSSVRTRAAVLFAVTIVASASAAMARPAYFHTTLRKAWPGANDTVTASPDSLRLWFSERVELPLMRITLSAARVPKPLGDPSFAGAGDDAPVVVAVREKLPPGKYTVAWTVAGKDGHPSKGTYDFVVKRGR